VQNLELLEPFRYSTSPISAEIENLSFLTFIYIRWISLSKFWVSLHENSDSNIISWSQSK